MSLLFGSVQPFPVSLDFAGDDEKEDIVLIDKKTWDAVTSTIDLDNEDKFAVTIEPLTLSRSLQSPSTLKALVGWGRLDQGLTSVQVPRRWLDLNPFLFPRNHHNSSSNSSLESPTHSLTIVNPVVLSNIVLVARSRSALELAQTNPRQIEQWFLDESLFIRHGFTYHFTAPSHTNGMNGSSSSPRPSPFRYEYSTVMTEPVAQGISQIGHTRFIVTAGDWAEPYSTSSDSDGESTYTTSEVDEYSDLDGLEIDEAFLENSILGPLSNSETGGTPDYIPNGDMWQHVSPEFADSPRAVPLDSQVPNGKSNDQSPSTTFVPRPIPSKGSSESSGHKGNDSETYVYLRTAELGKVGIFSGDWALVSKPLGPNARLARVFTDDEMVHHERPELVASPLFLHNIGTDLDELVVRPSPFGSRPPSLPTARSVTVARVSSPHASDRAYQPVFLRALKQYFENEIRLVKMGDLIAVGIHAEDARILGSQSKDENGDDDGVEDTTQDLLEHEYPLSSTVNTGVVFFKITNLEHDIIDVPETTSTPDAYFAATMGELGCWVDPKVTQMMQTGLEHSRVPDVISYLSIDRGYIPYPSHTIPSASSPYSKLLDLVSASLLPSAADYNLHLSVLLKGARGIGKQTTARWVAQILGVHLLEINCFDVVGETDAKTEGTLRARVDKAANCSPCILLLRHIEALARNTQTLETGKEPAMATILQDCLHDLRKTWKLTGYPVFVFGTSSEPEKIPQGVLSCFKHDILFESPAEAERLDILTNLLQDVSLAPDVNVKSIATQTAALVAGDLVDLVQRAQHASVNRAVSASPGASENDCILAGLVLTGADFENALGEARATYSEAIGAPKIPNVTWDDVGGLASVKKDILDTIELPLQYPELFADGLKKRSGILLYGPPGTGKTLLAKAVATSCSLNFFSVKGPELLNMYIGESEANVRRVFQRARDAKPCVIFFDELDSVAPKRGNHGDSGGVMDRIVSQLLAELDGMADGQGGADVFVIGATNRPDLLDSALLRPGRFDRMLYLGVSDTHEAQLNILHALTRKFRLDPDLDLRDIAEQCPFNYTGADFYALCSDAMLKSMSRKAQEIDVKIEELNALPPPYSHPHPLTPQYYLAEMATAAETDVLVSRTDFEQALRELVPSVSQGEMDHYREVQKKFANDTINAIKEDKDAASSENETFLYDGVETPPPTSSSIGSIVAPLVSRRDKGKGKAVD